MIRSPITRLRSGQSLTDDLEALALALGIFAVVLGLCLVSAFWPEAI